MSEWAAGVISIAGTFYMRRQNGRSSVTLTVKSKTHQDTIKKLADIAGVRSTLDRNGTLKMSVYGAKLHTLMKKVWDELPDSRKLDYARLRRAL